jgi:Glucose-regulated metallo-peptidase M90
MLDLDQYWHYPVSEAPGGLLVGQTLLRADDGVQGGAGVGYIAALSLRRGLTDYQRRVRGSYRPQLAALIFRNTGRVRALRGYFPLLRTLSTAERDDFFALVEAIATSDRLDPRLYDEGPLGSVRETPLPGDAAYLIAGQLAEIFFYRRDLLARLLAGPRHIRLFTTQAAFTTGGGVAGGCYRPADESIYLLLARLYEGFYTPDPGVAPFIHELGHLLDCFEPSGGKLGAASGLLPGLRPGDGDYYLPEAHDLYLRGKQIEIDRYEQHCAGDQRPESEPLGHPYVFQNDGEFIAGYLEMFFRNPHAFAERNPQLFEGLSLLFAHDPRRWRSADFAFYLDQNRAFYRAGQLPPPHGLTSAAGSRVVGDG